MKVDVTLHSLGITQFINASLKTSQVQFLLNEFLSILVLYTLYTIL